MSGFPEILNQAADLVSRESELVDTDDWQLEENFFSVINSRWGPFSVDVFANYYKKCERFYSLFYSPGAIGVDAFTYDWNSENCLLVPPVSIVGRALHHLSLCKSKGALIVPLWPSSHFWPLLFRDFNKYIKDILIVKGNKVLKHGLNSNSLLGSKSFDGQVLALFIDCS